MSKNRSSFLKRDREAKKREKQAVKQQRKEDRKRGELQDSQPFEYGETIDGALEAPVSETDSPPSPDLPPLEP